jgi:hypothetical protein
MTKVIVAFHNFANAPNKKWRNTMKGSCQSTAFFVKNGKIAFTSCGTICAYCLYCLNCYSCLHIAVAVFASQLKVKAVCIM